MIVINTWNGFIWVIFIQAYHKLMQTFLVIWENFKFKFINKLTQTYYKLHPQESMEHWWVTQTMIILITLLLLEPPLHHTVVHWNVSSSHRPRDIIIITSSMWHYHHSTARYFKFKYRCQNVFVQPWKLLRILQNNDAIK